MLSYFLIHKENKMLKRAKDSISKLLQNHVSSELFIGMTHGVETLLRKSDLRDSANSKFQRLLYKSMLERQVHFLGHLVEKESH